jgi:hypothetical protein
MWETNLKFQKISGKKLIIILLGRHSVGNGEVPPLFLPKNRHLVPHLAPPRGCGAGARGTPQQVPGTCKKYGQTISIIDIYEFALKIYN